MFPTVFVFVGADLVPALPSFGQPSLIWATTRVAPTIRIQNPKNPVKMIWHYRKFVKSNIFEFIRNFPPPKISHLARLIQIHLAILNIPKQTFHILRANCDKIRSILRIIIFFIPYRSPMMNFCIINHNYKSIDAFVSYDFPPSLISQYLNCLAFTVSHSSCITSHGAIYEYG